jgi:hypothetical protein
VEIGIRGDEPHGYSISRELSVELHALGDTLFPLSEGLFSHRVLSSRGFLLRLLNAGSKI